MTALGSVTSAFFKRHLFHDRKLRRCTLLELVCALDNDLLVCVVEFMVADASG